jgi:hypothetical protein
MSNRRRFLATMGGACGAAMACAASSRESGDALVDALRELNRAGDVGIAPDDFEAARDYAAGAYREAAAKLRPIVLDPGMDLPVAFSAKRVPR